MEVDSLSTAFGIVRNPGWASILPASSVNNDERHSGLSCHRMVEPSIRRHLVVAFEPQKEASPAAQLLIARLEAALSQPALEDEAVAHEFA